jgi:hypothetical protein
VVGIVRKGILVLGRRRRTAQSISACRGVSAAVGREPVEIIICPRNRICLYV